jgi:hypothetical protein
MERLKIKDSASANAVKNYIDGAELISPHTKSIIIDQQKKLMLKYYQNSYYKRRNPYSYSNSNYNTQLSTQFAARIAKTYSSTIFVFCGRGEDFGLILSKPETVTSLHTQKAIMVEKEVVVHVETEKILDSVRRGRKIKVGNVPREPIKDIFAF